MRGRGSGAAALAAGVRLRLAFGLGFVLALGVWPAQGAQAQTRYLSKVYVKGEMLEARIAALKPKGLVVTTEYGEGQLTIPWADVERIESQRTLVLAFGDEGEIIEGRLLGVDGDAILFGDDDASARRIPTASIYGGFDIDAWEGSRLTRLRARYRYWSGGLSLSGSVSRGPVNQEAFKVEVEAARKKGPTEYSFFFSYDVADSEDETDNCNRDPVTGNCTNNSGSNEQISKRIFYLMRQQYNFRERRTFAFSTQSIEWDDVDDIDLRVIPRIGGGYRVFQEERYTLSLDLGPAYIYNRNNGDFWSIGMGSDVTLNLPFGSKATLRLDYLPNAEDWGNDYLFTAKAIYTFPVLDWLAVRLTAENIHEGEPADDSRQNRFKGAAGVTFVF